MPIEIEVFTSSRCPSCTWAIEVVREVAEELGEAVSWHAHDTASDIERAARLGVRATPAIVIDGELVFTGTPTAKALREALARRSTPSDQ